MRFSDVIGHSSAKSRLIEMVDSGHLPHALLLISPPGSGEVMLGRALAQFIHCTGRKPGDTDSCGVCPSCRQHQSLNHADLHFSFPILKRGTAAKDTVCDDWATEWREFITADPWMDMRKWPVMLGKPDGQPIIYEAEADALRRKMALSARSSDINICLMWLPERMNDAAANTLLKLIEEPEEGTLFILVSNSSADVLPTIYSRCQRVELRRLSDEDIALALGEGLNPADALAAAHVAEGNFLSARDALGSDENRRNLDLFMRLMRLAYARKVGDLKIWSEEVASLGRLSTCRFLEYCQRMVRENFIMNLRVPALNYLTEAEQQFSARFFPFINERNVEWLIQEFNDAEIDIRGNGSAKIVLFDLAIKIIMLIIK